LSASPSSGGESLRDAGDDFGGSYQQAAEASQKRRRWVVLLGCYR